MMEEARIPVPPYVKGDQELRVLARKDKGEIIEFSVQYETLIQGDWWLVVRYDTAHTALRSLRYPESKSLRHDPGALMSGWPY